MIPLVQAGMGIAEGAVKMQQGKNMLKEAEEIRSANPRPVRDVMGGVKTAKGVLRNLTTSGRMPGYDQIEQDVSRGTANALRAIMETGGTGASRLNAALAAGQGQQNQMRQVGARGAELQRQSLQDYAGFMGSTFADEERANFDWNERQKFQENAAAASALEGAGLQNKMTGMTDMMTGASGIVGGGLELGKDRAVFGSMMKDANPDASPKDIRRAFWAKRSGFGTGGAMSGSGQPDMSGYDRSFYQTYGLVPKASTPATTSNAGGADTTPVVYDQPVTDLNGDSSYWNFNGIF